jgi:hypothetical protein
MEFTVGKAQDLFDKGQFHTISHAAGREDSSFLASLPPELRVLIAHACVYTGRIQIATSLAESAKRANESPSVVAQAHIVTGLIRKREGQVDKAAAEFRNAVRIAKEGRDKYQLAWAQVHLFRLLAVVGYAEPHLAATLADARRCVTGSGDALVMAYLHDSVATMEAQRGHTVEAERHLRLGRSLLTLRPSFWLEELIALNAACVALIDCDADGFDLHLAAARKSARLTGNVSTIAAIDVNEAHAAVLTGRFGRASSLVEKILRSPFSIHNELAARESLVRMQLAMGHVAECEAELTQLEARRPEDLILSFTFRGAAILKVRLLIRKKEYAAAAAQARAQISELVKLNDTSSIVVLTTLKALALGLSGDLSECCRALVDTNQLGASVLREHQADYAHACGLISKHFAPAKIFPFEDRSFRIWAEHGNKCGPVDAITARGYSASDEITARKLLEKHSPLLVQPVSQLHEAADCRQPPSFCIRSLVQAHDFCHRS